MKNNKKILSFILVFALILSLCFSMVACGNKTSDDVKQPTTSNETIGSGENTQNDDETLVTQPDTTGDNQEEITDTTENTTENTGKPLVTGPVSGSTQPTQDEATTSQTTGTPVPEGTNSRPVVQGGDVNLNGNTSSKPTGNGSTSTTTTGNGENSNNASNNSSNNSPNTSANQTTAQDDTAFASYQEFYSAQVESKNYSFSAIPDSASKLKESCSCNITFSGSITNGSVSMKINGKNHEHSWKTASLMNVGSTMLSSCETCGFVKGDNFIYVKIPSANHGHGWSWPTETIIDLPDFCACGYEINGNYTKGSVFITRRNGTMHGHVWGGDMSIYGEGSIESEIKDYASNSQSLGKTETAEMTEIVTYPNRGCQECGFRRYTIATTRGIKGVVSIGCGWKADGVHTYEFWLHNSTPHELIQDEYTHSNCSCGFRYTGDEMNGAFDLMINGKRHGHGWNTSAIKDYAEAIEKVKDALGETTAVDENIKSITELNAIDCKICHYIRTKSGFSVRCPDTGMKHTVQFGYRIFAN